MDINVKDIYIEFIKQNKGSFFIYFILLMAYPLEKIYVPQLYSGIITKLNSNLSFNTIKPLLIMWGVIQGMYLLINHLDGKLIPRFKTYIRDKVLLKFVNSLELDLQDVKHGDFLTKLIKIPDALHDLFDQIKYSFFINSILLIFLVYFFFKQNTTLGIVMLVFLLTFSSLMYIYYLDSKELHYKKEVLFDDLHEDIQDILNNSTAIFAYQQKENELSRINKLQLKSNEVRDEITKCNSKWNIIFGVLALLMFVIINVYTIKLYNEKKLTDSQVITIIIIIYSQMDRIMKGYYETAEFIMATSTIDEVFDYLNKLNSNVYKTGNDFVNGDIVFKNVSFKYKTAAKKQFDNFNLVIKKNETTAIIGHIGSGKSTLIKMLMKYNDFESGDVTIGGQSIKDTDVVLLRRNISYVPQNTVLFNRTLFENITYGTENVSKKQILNIFDTLNMPDLKKKFSDRMDTSVGKNGGELSGGQRQIVWLLRAFLNKKPIVIIDEPTSSLDPSSTKEVMKMIKELFKNKTVIIVTHDDNFSKSLKNIVNLNDYKV